MARMVLCVVVACMVLVAAPYAEAVLNCARVDASLKACIPYLTGNDDEPPESCCNQILALNASVSSQADRQATCNCLQSAAGSVPGINLGLAVGLPGRCGVNIGISANTDCSQVQ